MEDKVKFTARISYDKLEDFRLIAEYHHRSGNGEICAIIDDYIKENQDILDKLKSQEN